MEVQNFSRRKFINKCVSTCSILFGGLIFLNSCDTGDSGKRDSEAAAPGKSGDPCDDLSGIPEQELKKRESLGYVKKTPNPQTHCGNCALFIPAGEDDTCGGCLLFEGPVQFNGYCVQWAAITESS